MKRGLDVILNVTGIVQVIRIFSSFINTVKIIYMFMLHCMALSNTNHRLAKHARAKHSHIIET